MLELRPCFAPLEIVFAELKELSRRSAEIMFFPQTTDALEAKLVERNRTAHNIGLACYCISKEVPLYKHSKDRRAATETSCIRETSDQANSVTRLFQQVILCLTSRAKPSAMTGDE